jgi:hypothetical protein
MGEVVVTRRVQRRSETEMFVCGTLGLVLSEWLEIKTWREIEKWRMPGITVASWLDMMHAYIQMTFYGG